MRMDAGASWFHSKWMLLLVALGPCVACGEREGDCRRLIGKVNDTLREIDQRPRVDPEDVPAVARDRAELAQRYGNLSEEVVALKLSDPELVPRAKRYAELARSASGVLAKGVKALEKRDPEAVEKSRQEFDRITHEEAAMVREINALCLPDVAPAPSASR